MLLNISNFRVPHFERRPLPNFLFNLDQVLVLNCRESKLGSEKDIERSLNEITMVEC